MRDRKALWVLQFLKQEISDWERQSSGRQWLWHTAWELLWSLQWEQGAKAWACPAAGVLERYEDRCQKSDCVHVLMWVCGSGDGVAVESQCICEVLYLLLYTLKKELLTPNKMLQKSLRFHLHCLLKFLSMYLSPFLKVQLAPVTIGFCFVCFLISINFLFLDNFD